MRQMIAIPTYNDKAGCHNPDATVELDVTNERGGLDITLPDMGQGEANVFIERRMDGTFVIILTPAYTGETLATVTLADKGSMTVADHTGRVVLEGSPD